eukprot:1122204-Amphidinium_carterae.1
MITTSSLSLSLSLFLPVAPLNVATDVTYCKATSAGCTVKKVPTAGPPVHQNNCLPELTGTIDICSRLLCYHVQIEQLIGYVSNQTSTVLVWEAGDPCEGGGFEPAKTSRSGANQLMPGLLWKGTQSVVGASVALAVHKQ